MAVDAAIELRRGRTVERSHLQTNAVQRVRLDSDATW
jgi:hypothetical protein